jgi:solute carrier family 36 (proton-coupled amino acid transporter)
MDLLGCCCVYVLFVSKNLKQVVDHYTESSIDLRYYMLGLLPFLIMINLIRNLKHLSPLSMIANALIFVGMIITFYYMLIDLPPISSRPYFAPLHRLPSFFGTVIFALEGIGVVMPLENNMRNPRHFIGCPGVLNIGMSFVVTMYALTGFLGYLKYGEDTEESITLNLPQGEL